MSIEDELREFVRREARAVFEEMAAELRAAPSDSEDLISLRHASQKLDIPVDTLEKWVRSGRVTKYKIGGCVRVKLSDLLKQAE